jgi:hypothetical protein
LQGNKIAYTLRPLGGGGRTLFGSHLSGFDVGHIGTAKAIALVGHESPFCKKAQVGKYTNKTAMPLSIVTKKKKVGND